MMLIARDLIFFSLYFKVKLIIENIQLKKNTNKSKKENYES